MCICLNLTLLTVKACLWSRNKFKPTNYYWFLPALAQSKWIETIDGRGPYW